MLGTHISVKGQVTVPKDIRLLLQLKAGDRVAFVADGDKAIMVPVKGDLLSLKGALRKHMKGRPLSAKAMTETAKRHVVSRYWAHRHGA